MATAQSQAAQVVQDATAIQTLTAATVEVGVEVTLQVQAVQAVQVDFHRRAAAAGALV